MTSIIDLRTRRPVSVCAHKRSRPYDATFIAKTQQLMTEVAVEQAMRDACDEIERFATTLNDPTMGLAH